MRHEKISPKFIVIDFSVFIVHEYEEGIKRGFKKGSAYIVDTDFVKLVLPFRGVLKDIDNDKRFPGIYISKKNPNIHRFILPKHKNSEEYSIDNIRKTDKNIFSKGNFVKGDILIDGDGEVFKPRINVDDDLTLKIFKVAYNLKNAPLSAFDNRFQAIDIGTNPSNRKSNAKKAIVNNSSLSSTKLVQLGDVVDLDVAVVIKDKPGSVYPMRTDGKPIVLYSGNSFPLKDAIDVSRLDLESLYEVWED